MSLHTIPTDRAHSPPAGRRGRHLGHAGGQRRAHVPGDEGRQGGLQPGRLLVAARQLEEPDAHAQPRHDLSHALLQHEGRRADGAGDSAGREEASITGSIDDAWQTALEDVGPAGVDKGKGGKYLILPPGYKDKAPDGYIALPSHTYTGFVILRSNLKSGSDADIAKAVAYGKRIKFYPLSQAANPPADEVRRCDRRPVRQHHPLRPALLPDARPLRAARAVAGARQGR